MNKISLVGINYLKNMRRVWSEGPSSGVTLASNSSAFVRNVNILLISFRNTVVAAHHYQQKLVHIVAITYTGTESLKLKIYRIGIVSNYEKISLI